MKKENLHQQRGTSLFRNLSTSNKASNKASSKAISLSLSRAKSTLSNAPPRVLHPSSKRPPFKVHLPLTFSHNPNAAAGALCLGTAGIILTLISVGGLTRLTKSGLSMVHWSPHRVAPPTSREEWEGEFAIYKTYPEWQQRQSMTLDEFKYIFYWEWGHRILGRVVGTVYGGGLLALAATKRIPAGYGPRMFGLLALGGAQGAVGWWMVKSGLEEGRRGDRKEIRVSPYRLAAHLCTAVATYSGLVWTGMELLYPEAERRQAAKIVRDRLAELPREEAKEAMRKLRGLRGSVAVTTGLTFLTLASGAFVAGNSAGNAYNDWPLFNGEVVPWEDMKGGEGSGIWKLFENTAVVQFDHRMLAYLTAAAAGATLMRGRGATRGKLGDLNILSTQTRTGLGAMGAATAGQVTLGITTLVSNVPIELAAMHQLGSVAVLSAGLWTMNGMRFLGPKYGKEVAKRVVK
ncbi:hypothetical protein TrRE_jg8376 [Triparma retinervis]|uniref:Uncharacterized protein n=1 Tax=Triparma retinervis TaxID=2557542 RepID=A0A9W6ZN52_9STRA|nr:hypothetical protein TrRE_jg8376 [Triparma retinervis]